MREAVILTNIPAPQLVKNARLPELYETAKITIVECAHIDECKDWADRAEALSSYARQAGDKTLRKMADRIQARAVKRCGVLLKKIEKASGMRTDLQPSGRASIRLSRKQAAKDAGLSKDQAVTAIRVSNIPDDEFEEAIESDNPPTVTVLSEKGKHQIKKRFTDPQKQLAKALVPIHSFIAQRRKYLALLKKVDIDTKSDFISQIEIVISTLSKWIEQTKGAYE